MATMITTTHPETELVPYLRGELQGEERERIAHHLEHCGRCRDLVEAFAEALRELSDRIEQIPLPEWAASGPALPPRTPRTPPLQLITTVLLNVAIFGVLLFAPAGRLAWWRGWVLLGVVLVCSTATIFGVFASRPELLAERYKPPLQKSQPFYDKIVLIALIGSFAGLLVLIPLDVFRLHLMGMPENSISSLGMVLFILGWLTMSLSFRENAYAAPVVKHQAERQHVVVDTGVYRVVRHPMYAGAVLLMIGMPLWLQSYAATVFAAVPIALLALRIVLEEQFLRRELKDYKAYAARVRSRLIPFVW
jgi:protein-S-isoprenylcysteine O-methyltransferase Ste14